MSRFRNWANNGQGSSRAFSSPAPSPSSPEHRVVFPNQGPAQVVQPQPAPLFYSPNPNPVILQVPAYMNANQQSGSGEPMQTAMLVKPDGSYPDMYAAFVESLPDLTGGKSPAKVDAMKLTGRPEHAAMKSWEPTTRYYNGETDLSAKGTIENHGFNDRTSDGKPIRVTAMSARNVGGMSISGLQQGRTTR